MYLLINEKDGMDRGCSGYLSNMVRKILLPKLPSQNVIVMDDASEFYWNSSWEKSKNVYMRKICIWILKSICALIHQEY